MAIGDGIRRNIRTVPAEERARFVRALLALQGRGSGYDPGRAGGPPTEADGGPGFDQGGSPLFDDDALRQEMQAHRGPEFLAWHRDLCSRFEQMLRDVDPALSLHYWDWNEDPYELFTPTMLGAGELPFEGMIYGGAWLPQDAEILAAPTFTALRSLLQSKSDTAHFIYFGGPIVNAHISFHDPFAFLLHSNVDRLYAMWQAQPGESWRLDPARVYGSDGDRLESPIADALPGHPGRQWAAADAASLHRTYAHPSIVAPPCYDTLPRRLQVDEATNPGGVINFDDVYPGTTFARAACLKVFGGGNLTFVVSNGPTGPYAVITPGGAVTVAHTPSLYQEARIWFGYTGAAPNSRAPEGAVTIRCTETGQAFVFRLRGNTVARPVRADVSFDASAAPLSDPLRREASSHVTWSWTWRPTGS